MSATVFISSPSRGMEALRPRVRALLEHRGYQALGMETFGPDQRPPLRRSLEELDRSQLYLGLLADSLGTSPPDDNPRGLSYTELEYAHALKTDKDILWFLDPSAGSQSDVRLTKFRELLLNRHVAGIFSDWSVLEGKLLAALESWELRWRLSRELTRRYHREGSSHRFILVPDDPGSDEVFRRTARIVRAEINARLDRDDLVDSVVVGVAGGRAHKRIVDHLVDSTEAVRPGGYAGVVFVALNAAAISRRYAYTANYLVTRLSEIFEHSSHLVCLPNATPVQSDQYADTIKRMRLVLGGAGGRDGFLKEWLASGFTPPRALPSEAVGDFCYLPITERGEVVEPQDREMAEAMEALYVQPRIKHVSQLGAKIVLPLVGQPQELDGSTTTKKGLVGHTVLKRANVGPCILSQSVANDLLAEQLCGYVLREELGADEEGVRWQATPSDATGESAVVRIVHQAHSAVPLRRFDGDVNDEIVIADPPDEYDPRRVRLLFRRETETFEVLEGVRRPGLWSTTAVRAARRLLGDRTGLDVLDMGCGSGVIGCLAGRDLRARRVTFADIQAQAVRCAEGNATRLLGSGTQKEFLETDLFAKVQGAYDLVILSPPYQPEIVETNQPEADRGGRNGILLALRFADEVHEYLKPGGVCLMLMADYVPHGDVEDRLKARSLATSVGFRHILYPYNPGHGYPAAYEVAQRSLFETFRDSVFTDQIWGDERPGRSGRHYLAFRMTEIVGRRPPARGTSATSSSPGRS
jgi:release factor glutamine methyltransferase